MDKIIAFFGDPVNYAIIVAFLGVIKAIGVTLDKIGEKIDGVDKFEKAGASIGKFVSYIGKALNWVSPGHGGFKK